MTFRNPKKALVLSFHGWTGSGKNYLASMIGRSMFRKGMQSAFVHLFVATLHFPHPEEVATYQVLLRAHTFLATVGFRDKYVAGSLAT